MKQWPDEGPVPADMVLDPLVEALRWYYPHKYDHLDDYNGYDGYDIVKDKAVALGAEIFSNGAIRQQKEDQDRDPDEQILLLAFQLGVEQGRRIEKLRNEMFATLKAIENKYS